MLKRMFLWCVALVLYPFAWMVMKINRAVRKGREDRLLATEAQKKALVMEAEASALFVHAARQEAFVARAKRPKIGDANPDSSLKIGNDPSNPDTVIGSSYTLPSGLAGPVYGYSYKPRNPAKENDHLWKLGSATKEELSEALKRFNEKFDVMNEWEKVE